MAQGVDGIKDGAAEGGGDQWTRRTRRGIAEEANSLPDHGRNLKAGAFCINCILGGGGKHHQCLLRRTVVRRGERLSADFLSEDVTGRLVLNATNGNGGKHRFQARRVRKRSVPFLSLIHI